MSKLWEYYGKCITGKRHREKEMLCQDRWAYKQKEARQAIALIDGIGHTDKNVLAGQQIAEYITEFLVDEFEMLMEEEQQTITCQILKGVHRIIEKFMDKYRMPKEEFASTIMAICIDHQTGKFCTIHLGDGIIFHMNCGLQIMSYPMNGFWSSQTYLTISENALQNMKVFRGEIGDTSEYVLMTDGMYSYPIERENLLAVLDNKRMDDETEDDRSVVYLKKSS